MADHDLAAELQGYRDELATCEARGLDERAGLVRKEITRVEDEIREAAEGLEREAAGHEEAGQDVRAAEARVKAREYREVLPAEARPKRGPGRPRKETAEDKTPKERA
ncbi:hypothetical protein [Actinomadura sp. WMMA1423]|uniref:hypothetical protein n=1 Tax=Actinomadura sp. WMMA1423 TaxID=2591108 RepID=UPI001147177E|nr:hypothetical protein [Actinomadura sp. WMMA1423]